jgi:hypothetical protein
MEVMNLTWAKRWRKPSEEDEIKICRDVAAFPVKMMSTTE